MDGADSGMDEDDDPFATKLMSFEQGGGEYTPLVIGRPTLRKIPRTSVFVKKWPLPLRYQFFRNILDDISITMCQSCFNVSDDFSIYCAVFTCPINTSFSSIREKKTTRFLALFADYVSQHF